MEDDQSANNDNFYIELTHRYLNSDSFCTPDDKNNNFMGQELWLVQTSSSVINLHTQHSKVYSAPHYKSRSSITKYKPADLPHAEGYNYQSTSNTWPSTCSYILAKNFSTFLVSTYAFSSRRGTKRRGNGFLCRNDECNVLQ